MALDFITQKCFLTQMHHALLGGSAAGPKTHHPSAAMHDAIRILQRSASQGSALSDAYLLLLQKPRQQSYFGGGDERSHANFLH